MSSNTSYSSGSMSGKDQNHSHLFVFSGDSKAGMKGIDKDKQAKTIYEMSKNSAFFKHAEDQDKKTQQKIASMKASLAAASTNTLSSLRLESDKSLTLLEMKRDLNRVCCVLDMDMFFAAVEIRDQPHLRDKPVAVGGIGMISTANYVARKYGVRSAMPGFIAKKLCPELIFVPHNFAKYEVVGQQIRDIIKEYDPHYRSYSLDEVYFDLTQASKNIILSDRDVICDDISSHHISIEELRVAAGTLLHTIRERITTATIGLTCSAGLSNNFFLAKICADVNKPNGQYELPPYRDDILTFLSSLPTRKVGGIGKVMEKMLSDLDMKTMGDVRENIHKINYIMTPSSAYHLTRTCIGISEEEASDESSSSSSKHVNSSLIVDRKSIGAERTFGTMSDPIELRSKLAEICEIVSNDMKQEQLLGKAVTLKLKTVDFELCTRIATSPRPIQSMKAIEALALPILERMLPIKIRLMGVTVTKLEKEGMKDYLIRRHGFIRKDDDAIQTNRVGEVIHVDDDCDDDDEDIIGECSDTSSACPICNKRYQSHDELSEHVEVCISLAESQAHDNDIPPSTALSESCTKLYCPLCNLEYSNLLALNLHLDRCISSNNHPTDSSQQIHAQHDHRPNKRIKLEGNGSGGSPHRIATLDKYFIKN